MTVRRVTVKYQLLLIGALLALLATAAVINEVSSRMQGIMDEAPPALDESSFAAIVEVVAESASDSPLSETTFWSGESVGVSYERGSYPQRSGPAIHVPAPVEGEEFTFASWPGLRLSAEGRYTVALTVRHTASGEPVLFAHVVLESASGQPAAGLPESIKADLEVAAMGNATPQTALLEIARDLEIYGRAAAVSPEASEAGQLAALHRVSVGDA